MENNKYDKFSWKRVSMVSSYYSTRLRWQVMFYPLVSLFVFMLSMIAEMVGGVIVAQSLTGLLQYLVIFGPLVFAFRRKGDMDYFIPVSGTEKATFLAIYCLIVLPILVLAPCEIANQLVYERSIFTADLSAVPQLKTMVLNNTAMAACSILQMLTGASICMWVVSAVRRKVVLKSILFTLITFMVLGLVSGIFMTVAILKGNGVGPQLHRMPVINYEVVGQSINEISSWMIPALSLIIIFAVWRTFKANSKIKE